MILNDSSNRKEIKRTPRRGGQLLAGRLLPWRCVTIPARVPSVASALAAATANGGSVLSEAVEVEHGPSWVPEEPDEMENMVLEAVVADPSGFPLLLHECADADAACLSGARMDVYEWKRSQEWCVPSDPRAPKRGA